MNQRHPCRCSTYRRYVGGLWVQNGQGCPWVSAEAMFLRCKNSPSANVQGGTFADEVSIPSISKGLRIVCSEAARMPLVLRSNKFALQTCSPKIYTDVYFGRGCRWFQAEASSHCELVVEQCTGMYTVQQSISKGLRIVCSEAAWMPLILRSNKFWNKTCPPPMYMDVHRWRGTRRYTVQQAYGKRILYNSFYGIYSFV